MQSIPIHINFIAVIIFLGVFFGLYVSYFLIIKSFKTKSPNLFMGLLILVLSLVMFEGWLNYSSYIFKVLWLANFSEPLNFLISPLVYLFITSQLGDEIGNKKWLHFIPFIFWLGYCMFYFSVPEIFKYNDSINVMQLDIPYLDITQKYSGDPLGFRDYVNLATIFHISIYNIILLRRLILEVRKEGESIINTSNPVLKSLRNSFYHFIIIMVILIFVKSTFKDDVGDYLIFLYICFMIFLASYQIMDTSSYYLKTSSFLEGPIIKYQKSTLVDDTKESILSAIIYQMEEEKYFINSTASLSGLAKAINESSHHVSQVINEKLNQSFFEMVASYRVKEAKTILKTKLGKNLIIEEVAELVGYNSKSAFNTAFKKFTSQTPSAFRDSN